MKQDKVFLYAQDLPLLFLQLINSMFIGRQMTALQVISHLVSLFSVFARFPEHPNNDDIEKKLEEKRIELRMQRRVEMVSL